MEQVISSYIRKHTLFVTTVVILGFLALAAGEYVLFRKQMVLSRMLSEGIMQIKEGQK